ncbi:MAG: hypothetical protein JNG90_15985, partial [Planctomycetaceae bacterium]|nr:hypothetical protein [Planctomycetaceae bacterium]
MTTHERAGASEPRCDKTGVGPLAATWQRVESRLVAALEELAERFVDPRDAYTDADGAPWLALGGLGPAGRGGTPLVTEQQLTEVREQCRQLALRNEFAINGLENRISYIVGRGHTYRAAAKKRIAQPAFLTEQAQDFLDEFLWLNRWPQRQPELLRRRDRDGEAFVRLFTDHAGMTRLRFVEPGAVTTPPAWRSEPACSLGIRTEP